MMLVLLVVDVGVKRGQVPGLKCQWIVTVAIARAVGVMVCGGLGQWPRLVVGVVWLHLPIAPSKSSAFHSWRVQLSSCQS